MTATKEDFFKPGKMSAQDKASAIDHAARQIIDKEATQRALKTERLRKLREAQEAANPATPAPRAKTKRG
jgi:sRNA-binding protein